MAKAKKNTSYPEVHPANLYPLLEGKELQELQDDIHEHGLRDPIELCDGKIIDGRNRLVCLKALGITPTYKDITTDDPMAYVKSKNCRRALTPSQKAMVNALMKAYYRDEAKKRQAEGQKKGGKIGGRGKKIACGSPEPQAISTPKKPRHRSRDDIAGDDCSGPSVQRAIRVDDHGCPELGNAVLQGHLSVACANDLTYLSNSQQQEAIVAHREGDKKTTKKLRALAKRKKPPSPNRAGKTKQEPPAIIKRLIKDHDTLIQQVKNSEKGTTGQRERAVTFLEMSRDQVRTACGFLY